MAAWDEATAGKAVFLKFFAPWCGHCKAMKPAWDKLMAEYEGSASALVADVDCTAGGKDLCEESGVQGFPTVKYGDPSALEDYEGGRDFDSMQKFAKENLGPRCGPASVDLCSEEQQKTIADFTAMSADDLQAKITEGEDALKKADEDLEELLKSLQSQYEEGKKANEAAKKSIKESGLGVAKSVQAHKKKGSSEL